MQGSLGMIGRIKRVFCIMKLHHLIKEFGHIAVEVDGKVYTYGRYGETFNSAGTKGKGNLLIVDKDDYLNYYQKNTNVREFVLNLSEDKEEQIKKYFSNFVSYGFSTDIKIQAHRRPASGHRAAHRRHPPRRLRTGVAGRHGVGQDVHRGQRHCRGEQAHAGAEPQQDAGGTALRGDEGLLPKQCRRLLCIIL